MNSTLAALAPGFADPVHDAQAVFRRALDAMARPGRIVTLPSPWRPPPDDRTATTALLLALLDADVRLHIDGAPDGPLAQWLHFHSGVRLVPDAGAADWLLFDAAALDGERLAALPDGEDESPHTAPTLVVDVPALDIAPQAGALGLSLSGPGIETRQSLHVGGLAASFWHQRIAQQADYPRGIDLMLCCGPRFAAIPRSTRITLAGD